MYKDIEEGGTEDSLLRDQGKIFGITNSITQSTLKKHSRLSGAELAPDTLRKLARHSHSSKLFQNNFPVSYIRCRFEIDEGSTTRLLSL